MANWTLIILFLEMLKFSKIISSKSKKNIVKNNSEYLETFHLLKWFFSKLINYSINMRWNGQGTNYGISGSLGIFSKGWFLLSFLSKTLGHSGKIMMLDFVGHLRKFLCCPIKVEVRIHLCPNIVSGFRVEVSFHGLSFFFWAVWKIPTLGQKNSGCFWEFVFYPIISGR